MCLPLFVPTIWCDKIKSAKKRLSIQMMMIALSFVIATTANLAIANAAFIGVSPNAYKDWVETRGQRFTHARYLSAANGAVVVDDPAASDASVAFHWIIENGKLSVGLAVEAEGWIAFGFTEMGGMSGADIVAFEVGSGKLQDMYSVAYEHPKVDSQQDWTLVHSETTEEGLIILEMERDLDTGDSMDWALEDDTSLLKVGTRMIAAWGDSAEMQYHGPRNRLQATLRLFSESNNQTDKSNFDRVMAEEAEGFVSLYMKNITVLSRRTTSYSSTCISVEELGQQQGLPMDKPVHLLGFEFDLDPGILVHHLVLYSSTSKTKKSKCEPNPSSPMQGWVKGQSKVFLFPDDVAMLLADESERAGEGLGVPVKSLRLEAHLENPEKLKGMTDNSGVRLYYTTKLRKYTGDTIDLADPVVKLVNYPIGDGIRRHSYLCPSSCTKRYLPRDGVKAIYQVLHMHAKGLTMEVVHRDSSGQRKHTSAVQYFDASAGGQIVTNSFTVMPGDTLQTHCTYQGNPTLRFGYGKSSEMCLANVFYYPAVLSMHLMCTSKSRVPECSATYTNVTLRDESSLARTFGVPGTQPPVNLPGQGGEQVVSTASLKQKSQLQSMTAVSRPPALVAILLVFLGSSFVFTFRRYNGRPALSYDQLASNGDDGSDGRVLELT